MRIAFVTSVAHPDGRPDDAMVAELVGAEFRIWDDESVDWLAYDLVVIRSVWDYSHRVDDFLGWCESVGSERLRNRPDLVAFNADKRYLGSLKVPTIPTIFLEAGEQLPAYHDEIVVKPNISAGARDTGRFAPDGADEAAELVAQIQESGRIALMQPYLPGVDSHGETAVVFFAGEVSHVLRKRPVLRGAGIAPLSTLAHGPAAVMLDEDLVGPGSATEAELRIAHAVEAEITARFRRPLYMRVDMVPGPDRSPVVMELEMMEPSLYLHLVPGSVERFAGAVRRSLEIT